MKNVLQDLISKSGLSFLEQIEFEEKTAGRFFQKNKLDLGNGWKQFFVVLGAGVESPIHNHAGQSMEETHMIIYGSGKFIVYRDIEVQKEIILKRYSFHEVFSDQNRTPNHKYVAGPEGSIAIALERLY